MLRALRAREEKDATLPTLATFEKRPRAWDISARPSREKKRPSREKKRAAHEKMRAAREKKRAAREKMEVARKKTEAPFVKFLFFIFMICPLVII